MPSSELLNELSRIDMNSFLYNAPITRPDFDDTIRYDTYNIKRVFDPISNHLECICKNCHGFSLAINTMETGYQKYREDKYFYVTCSCGEIWKIPIILYSIQFRGMSFEDLISKINLEILEDRRKRISTENIETNHMNVPLQYRQAISSLEVL